MVTQRTTIPYSAPECECQEELPGDILCDSLEGGQSEDIYYEDWTI